MIKPRIVATGATGKTGSVVSTELLIEQSIPCLEHQEETSWQVLRYPLGVRIIEALNLLPLPLGQAEVLPHQSEDGILLHAGPELQLTDRLVREPHSFRERFGLRKGQPGGSFL